MNKHYETLEFNLIIDRLKNLALSDGAKTKIENLEIYKDINIILAKQLETTNGKTLIENLGTPPLFTMKEIYSISGVVEKGDMFSISELKEISSFISSCNRMRDYLKRGLGLKISLATWHESFIDLNEIKNEIDRTILGEEINSKATSNLMNIRRKLEFTNNQIKTKLDSILASNKKYLSDEIIVTRGDRYAIPVKKEYKNKVNGTVLDVSRVGSTYYIEPKSISKLQEDYFNLKLEEDNEIRKILYTLTALVGDEMRSFQINTEQMETLDFIFAKSKLSIDFNGNPCGISVNKEIIIKEGRHPILPREDVVPLDLKLENKGLIITGPNTGGKTVTLKTVGLFTLMAQTGLHIPAKSDSILPITDKILCDIGDGQSIEENLSTFSSHMKNIIEILDMATEDTLVLLDELGSGTDPDEGMGLAIAILDELIEIDSMVLSTTHYPEVKNFCDKSSKYINGCMAFDKENMKPLYKLIMGKHGESCALYIAEKLGLKPSIIKKANDITYNSVNEVESKKDISKYINKAEKKFNSNNGIKKEINEFKDENRVGKEFEIGDSVIIFPKKEIGIVYKLVDKLGNVGVQLKGKKFEINYKRLKIKVKNYELYPPDYDFSIIFDTTENRKKRHIMGKRHDENLVIETFDN